MRINGTPYNMYPSREYENGVKKARIEDGITARELAEMVNTNIAAIYNLENGYSSPISVGGGIKPWVLDVCRILNSTPEFLFPREICSIQRLTLNSSQILEITVGNYSRKTNQHRVVEAKTSEIFKKIESLSGKKKEVINMRFFKDMTFREIGDILCVSTERVRQIEAGALRNLRKLLPATMN